VIGVGVVGCGYWGPRVIRNFHALDGCEVLRICDLDPARTDQVRRTYPTMQATRDFRDLLDDPAVDAVAICTPVHTHYSLACAALEAGKHVLVEKPLTDSAETAAHLVELAERRGLVLQVDHVFVYSGAVQKLRELIDAGDLGDLLYLDFVRVNLGLFQPDVSVLWDLAPHDLSILQYLVDRPAHWVSAVGSAHYGPLEDQAYITVGYDDTLIAHVHVNWLAPVKLRSTLIGASKRMIVYDDLAPSEKIRVYDKGVTISPDSESRERALVDYRVGDMFVPYIDKFEPLERLCQTFVRSIETGERPATDGRAGLEVVRVLEAAQQSIRKNGERIRLA
jgi:predicted dehydrogenase